MKRRDIKTAIDKAKESKTPIKERATLYDNVINFILQQSDKERCDYYDRSFLYLVYGIEPNLDTFSDTKRRQIGILFSLLKRQRNGFINSLQSMNCKNLPIGQSPQVASQEDISISNKIKDKEFIEKLKRDGKL